MCFFCDTVKREHYLDYNDTACILFDQFPVTQYHLLVFPKKHIETYFELTDQEQLDIISLIKKWKHIITNDVLVSGFNIGWNCGESAGQTIDHAHCHMIPRRDGDIKNPTGGVRGCIPTKMDYKNNDIYKIVDELRTKC